MIFLDPIFKLWSLIEISCHVSLVSFNLDKFSGCFSYFKKKCLCIYFCCASSSLQHAGSFSCSMQTLSCGMWTLSCGMRDLVPQLGIKPQPPALGAWILTHWTTREVPAFHLYDIDFLESLGQLFCTMSFNLDLPDYFLMMRFSLNLFGENTT